MTKETEAALDYIQDLSGQRFWGFLTLKFEGGTVVHVRQEENLKPNELPGRNKGKQYERNGN